MFAVPQPPTNEAERLDFLYSCGILDTSPDERFDRITRLAAQFYEADAAFIGFIDDRYQWMKSIQGEGLASWIERDRSVCQLVIASGKPLVIGDMKADSRLEGHPVVPLLPFRFYAGVPLVTDDGAAVASLCILKREPQDADGFNLSPLEDLGAIAMDELELWRLNRELERASTTDGLTGLANRRAFDAALDQAWRRLERTREPLSLLLFDLDFFKILNDRAGHPAGDEALRHFAKILSEATGRPDDFAARYGGEEFALVLPDTDGAGALAVARAVRDSLASARIAHPGGIGGCLTTSIGLATIGPEDVDCPDALVARADTALYRAKQQGRDCCVPWSA
ncbi:diguanylate cyclase [Microvirga sp. Marseille-Q2068]|uniref:diguanylate cyclase n=1 Tax=Microvirga mediterraneensis TaxID=2754695 RepID=A0A838BPD3_9HYPH|nr:diguanylate cyclase [Microvirga mediterraneensis]